MMCSAMDAGISRIAGATPDDFTMTGKNVRKISCKQGLGQESVLRIINSNSSQLHGIFQKN